MNISSKDKNQFDLILTLDELRFIHQAFNEVCHGFRIENFDGKIGKMDIAKSEMDKLGQIYERANGQSENLPVSILLNLDQIALFRNILHEVLKEIEDWEFHTRTGETRKRAEELQAQLQKLLDGSWRAAD
jgi:hypothetical protein